MPRPTALYEISGAAINTVSELIAIPLTVGLKEFVIAIVSAAEEHGLTVLTRTQLASALSSHKVIGQDGQEKPLSSANSMISRRVKELESLGCLRIKPEYRVIDDKTRKCTVHSLLSLRGLIDHLNKDSHSSPAPQGRPKQSQLVVYSDHLTTAGMTPLRGDGDVVPYTEGAFSILEAASRTRSDKNTLIDCKYFLQKNDFVLITASTSTKEGAGIAYSSDQRVIQAFNGMLKESHDERQRDFFGCSDEVPAKLIGDYCFFDIYALTREIGSASNSRQNRDNVLKMVRRLKETTYSVDATNSPYWRERYMPSEQFTKGDYNYIQELYSATDWYAEKGHDGTEEFFLEDRFFVVKFHPLILNSITTPGKRFISHDSLKSERLDMVHRLNNWVKSVVGVRDKGYAKDHHQYTLDIFHDRVRQGSRLDNFERDFYSMAKRQDADPIRSAHRESQRFEYSVKGALIPSGTFWLNGYYYRLQQNEMLANEIYRKTRTLKKRRIKVYPVLTIWRDTDDPIVGDNSDHNLALRRQLKTLIDEGEGDLPDIGGDYLDTQDDDLKNP